MEFPLWIWNYTKWKKHGYKVTSWKSRNLLTLPLHHILFLMSSQWVSMAGQLPRPAVPLWEGADGEHGPEEDAGAEDAGVREEAARRPPTQGGNPEAQN